MTGRPKPTHLKAITGNPGGRPLNDREPIPPGNLENIPEHVEFDEFELKEFSWILETAPPGLLRRYDAWLALAFCQHASIRNEARGHIRAATGPDGADRTKLVIKSTNGNVLPNPLLHIFNAQTRLMTGMASDMGIGPAARARLTIQDEQPESPWAKYAKK
jgi:phage terminase small subunit